MVKDERINRLEAIGIARHEVSDLSVLVFV